MRQSFDAHLVEFHCPKCHARITEPIGSFWREYHCYQCGRQIKIPEIQDLEQRAESFGDRPYWIVQMTDWEPDPNEPTLRLQQERGFTTRFEVVCRELAERHSAVRE